MGGRYGGDIGAGHRERYFRVQGLRRATPEEVREAARRGKVKHDRKEDLTEGLTAELRRAMKEAAPEDPGLPI